MNNRKILPMTLVFLFICTSLSPTVDAFDRDNDGIDDSIETDADNDLNLDIDGNLHPEASDIWYWRGSESNDWDLYEE